ncbi:hypothetical protein [Mesorhizobium sp.]|nr:hypothetical protein [Mesorhizobium sp.]
MSCNTMVVTVAVDADRASAAQTAAAPAQLFGCQASVNRFPSN